MGKAGKRFLKFFTCGPVCLALEIAAERRTEEYNAEIEKKQQELLAQGKVYEAQLLAEEEESKDREAFDAAKRKVTYAALAIAGALITITLIILKGK